VPTPAGLTTTTYRPPRAPEPFPGDVSLRGPVRPSLPSLDTPLLFPTSPASRTRPLQSAPRPVDEWIKSAIENNPELVRARNLIQNSKLFAGLMSQQDFSWFFGNPPSNASWSANEWGAYLFQGRDPVQIVNTMALRWTLYSGKNKAAKEVALADVMLATVRYQEMVAKVSRDIQLNVNAGLRILNEIEATKAEITSFKKQIAEYQGLSAAGVILRDEVESLRAQLSAAEGRLQALETNKLEGTHQLAQLVGEENPELLAELPSLRQRTYNTADLNSPQLARRLLAGLPNTPAHFTPLNNSVANNPTTIYNTLFAKNELTIALRRGGWVRRGAEPPPSVSNIDYSRLSLLLNKVLGQTPPGRQPSPKLLGQLAVRFPQFFPESGSPPGTRLAATGSLRGILGGGGMDYPGLASNLLAAAQTQEGANRLNELFALPVLQNGVALASRLSPNDLSNIDISKLRVRLTELMQNGQGGTLEAQQLATVNYLHTQLKFAGARGEVSWQINPLALAFGGVTGLVPTVLGNLFSTAASFSGGRQRRADMQVARTKYEQGILQALSTSDKETRAIKSTLEIISGDRPGSTRAGWIVANNSLITSANRLEAIRHAVREGIISPHVKHPSYGMNLYEAQRHTIKEMRDFANYGHSAYLPKRIELMAQVGGLLDRSTGRVDPTANLLDGLLAQGQVQGNRATRRITFPGLL
jgi:hypothetical protein